MINQKIDDMSNDKKIQNDDETLFDDGNEVEVTEFQHEEQDVDANLILPANTVLQGSKYRIVRKLGQGGFGITYEGMQTGLNRKVAIKEFFMKEYCGREDSTTVTCTLLDNSKKVQSSQKKFLKEARMIADLQHTNIVKIIDVFEENNTVYYVMEHIEGGSLQEYVVNRGCLSEKKALSLIRQIASALDCVHQRNILHLDVKPANVMMRDEDTAVLIDFGISKHYGETGTQTTSSNVGISRGYAPIEQYNEGGVATFSPATDIYSLGATLSFMLTGQRPPEAQIVLSEGLPLFPKKISKSTREAITAAMRPTRAERPQSIEAFLRIIDGGKVVVETDSQIRYVIEQLEIQGEYKEAYLRCMDCLEKGIEVEFAQKKCEILVPLMRKKNKATNRWMYFLAIVSSIVFFIVCFLYAIM